MCLGMKQKLRLYMPAQWNSPPKGASSSCHFDWLEAGCYRAQKSLCLELAVAINYGAEQPEVDGNEEIWQDNVPWHGATLFLWQQDKLSIPKVKGMTCMTSNPTSQTAFNNEIKLSFLSLFFSEKGFLPIALAVLELPLYTNLASYSQRSNCFCLLSVGIIGVGHHHPAKNKLIDCFSL